MHGLSFNAYIHYDNHITLFNQTSGRGLAEKQAIAVAMLVQGCPHPVFLRILSDIASAWPSFYVPDPENPPIQPAVESIVIAVSYSL